MGMGDLTFFALCSIIIMEKTAPLSVRLTLKQLAGSVGEILPLVVESY